MTNHNDIYTKQKKPKLSKTFVQSRWFVVLISILLVVIAGFGLSNLRISDNYRVFFGPNNPQLLEFQSFERDYTQTDNIFFTIKSDARTLRNIDFANQIIKITNDSWKIPFSIRVDSLSNYQYIRAENDDIAISPLFENGRLSSEVLNQRVNYALQEELLTGKFIDKSASTAGINVTMQFPGESLTEVPDAVNFAYALKEKIEFDNPDVTVAVSGLTAMNNAFTQATINDALFLFPLMFLVVTICTWLILRSIAATLLTLLVVNLSTIIAVGLSGWFGALMSPFSGAAPIAIMTLAVADCIHISIGYFTELGKGLTVEEAMTESLRKNTKPVIITSVTTMLGFLALNFSDAPPINLLGNIAALGVGAAMLLSLTLFPVLLSMVKPDSIDRTAKSRYLDVVQNNISSFVCKRPIAIIISAIVCVLLGVTLAQKNDLNDQWVEYFAPSTEIRQDTDYTIENLTGPYLIEFSIPAKDGYTVRGSDYLKEIDQLTAWLRQRSDVTHVFALSDLVKRTNRALHEDNNKFFQIPDTNVATAQVVLVYELSMPFGQGLNDRINVDETASRITITLEKLTTSEMRSFVDEVIQRYITQNPQNATPVATGAQVLFSHISQRNIDDMIAGNFIAIILIAFVLVLAVRSVSHGLVSMIPNGLPIVMTFGVWYLFVGTIGTAAATVTATTIGIIVDNCVHFLSRYLFFRRENNLSSESAIQLTFASVGKAITANAIILGLGFFVLSFSTFQITSQMGVLTSIAILIALPTALLLLPSLLLVMAKFSPGR